MVCNAMQIAQQQGSSTVKDDGSVEIDDTNSSTNQTPPMVRECFEPKANEGYDDVGNGHAVSEMSVTGIPTLYNGGSEKKVEQGNNNENERK